jgi:hypothetical protein
MVEMGQSEICAMLRTTGVQYLRKSTHVQEEEGSIINEYNVLLYN